MSSRSWKLIWVASCWLLWPGQSPAAQIIGPRVSRESSFVRIVARTRMKFCIAAGTGAM